MADEYDFEVEEWIALIRVEVLGRVDCRERRGELKRCVRHFGTLGFC